MNKKLNGINHSFQINTGKLQQKSCCTRITNYKLLNYTVKNVAEAPWHAQTNDKTSTYGSNYKVNHHITKLHVKGFGPHKLLQYARN